MQSHLIYQLRPTQLLNEEHERHLPLHLCKLQLSVEIFVPGPSISFTFGADLEHVRERVLFPPPHVTLHGCHGDHWLQLPLAEDWKIQSMT